MTRDNESTPTRRLGTKTLALIAGSAVIAIGAGGFLSTTALFTDEVTIGPNSVAAATLTLESQTVPMGVTDALPGVAGTPKSVAFTNTGSVPFTYSLSVENVSSDAAEVNEATILGWFDVTISSGTSLETGTLASLPAMLDAGEVAAGASGTATVTVTLNSAATNIAQGVDAEFDIVIDAKQVGLPVPE